MALTATKDQMDGLKSAIPRMIHDKKQEVAQKEYDCFMEEGNERFKQQRIAFQNAYPDAFDPPYICHTLILVLEN